jgi:subfamily B ATP-binding cassette protein MsbA
VNAYRAYFQFVKKYTGQIVATLLIGMVKFGIPLLLPLIIKYVVDHLLLSHALTTSEKLHQLWWILGGSFVVFVVIRYPLEYFRQYFAQKIASRVLFDIRNLLFDHLQRLSVRYYQNKKVGEIISRFMNDVEQTKNLVEVGMMNIWLDMFTLTIALGFMFYLNVGLTLAAITVFPLYAIAVKFLYGRLKELTKSRSAALADIQAYLHERIQGIPVIKSFTLEKTEQGRFQGRNGEFLSRAMAHTRWNAITFSIINTLTDIAPLAVIGYGGYLAIHGDLSVGSLVAFFGYLERLYSPLRRLVNSSTTMTQAAASLERVLELMHEPYDIVDAPDAGKLPVAQGHIQFDRVQFRYNDHTDWVLKDISLEIKPGQTVALVGLSGGGKSSLIGLLPRFYDVQEGDIRMDGVSIRTVTQQSLRAQIGMVLQDNFLFSGSVRDNILMGQPDASEDAVIQAAKAANAHEFILSLPHGYDTEIGERGVKLSGGQKQRIAIARVFLKDPRVLILDEATSALDLESEALIQQSLNDLARNRTTLIVAHRLSTITHADRIYVMDDGRIAEFGTHAELMARPDGIYARLFNVQNLTSN